MTSKKPIIIVLVLMVLILAGIFSYYWYEDTYYVNSQDAYVDYNIVDLSPQITGSILDIYVNEGEYVNAGDVIARVSDFYLTPGANVDHTLIRAPISGTIIKVLGTVGEMASPGEPVAMMADLKGLYVTANIQETRIGKVKPGQLVNFTVDAFPGHTFTGRVISLGEATASEFSLLPQQSSSGSFTKVVQRIPVKIAIDNYEGCTLLPGMSVEVKIHIK